MDTPRKHYPFTAYYWYVPNPLTGRLRRTRYRLSEAEALQYPGAVKDLFDALEIRSPGEERLA